jgi:hypothetical protein
MGLYDDAAKEAAALVKAAYNGTKRNGSNKAINAIANNGFGGLEAAGRALRGEGMESLTKTFGKNFDTEGKVTKWDAGKIAGSYLGAAAAGRVLTGGGIYKDGNGSTNLVGVPFV